MTIALIICAIAREIFTFFRAYKARSKFCGIEITRAIHSNVEPRALLESWAIIKLQRTTYCYWLHWIKITARWRSYSSKNLFNRTEWSRLCAGPLLQIDGQQYHCLIQLALTSAALNQQLIQSLAAELSITQKCDRPYNSSRQSMIWLPRIIIDYSVKTSYASTLAKSF